MVTLSLFACSPSTASQDSRCKKKVADAIRYPCTHWIGIAGFPHNVPTIPRSQGNRGEGSDTEEGARQGSGSCDGAQVHTMDTSGGLCNGKIIRGEQAQGNPRSRESPRTVLEDFYEWNPRMAEI